MSSMSRFKYQRGIPAPSAGAMPPFSFFNFKAVRQLDTTFQTITQGGPTNIWGQVIIPANTWAYQKSLMMKFALQLTIPAGVLPPFANVQEQIILTGGPVFTVTSAPNFVPVAGVFSSEFVWRMYNDGTNLWFWNEGETNAFWSLNHDDNKQHVQVYSVIAGTIDLTQQVTIALAAQLPFGLPGSTITPIFLQSFIEQGTNLGRATY